jgi:hypothetical protein
MDSTNRLRKARTRIEVSKFGQNDEMSAPGTTVFKCSAAAMAIEQPHSVLTGPTAAILELPEDPYRSGRRDEREAR